MASDYVMQLIRQYNENKNYKDTRSVTQKNSAKDELKRLGYSVTGRKLR